MAGAWWRQSSQGAAEHHQAPTPHNGPRFAMYSLSSSLFLPLSLTHTLTLSRTPSHTCGRRGFKALKQIVKLLFKLGRREEMMEAYR